MTNPSQLNGDATARTSRSAQASTQAASTPIWFHPRDLPGPDSTPTQGTQSDAGDFQRERERQARVARQHLRASLDRRKKFDAWMLVLLGFALAFWVQIVVTTLIRPASP